MDKHSDGQQMQEEEEEEYGEEEEAWAAKWCVCIGVVVAIAPNNGQAYL